MAATSKRNWRTAVRTSATVASRPTVASFAVLKTRLVELGVVESVSHETARKTLKKMNLSLN